MTQTTTNITQEQKDRLLALVFDLAGRWPAAELKTKLQSDYGVTSYLDLTRTQFDELLAYLTAIDHAEHEEEA